MPKTYENNQTSLALMQQDVTNIKSNILDVKSSITDMNKKMDSNFVTNDRFEPVQRIVYGFAGLLFVAVVGGILSLVIKK